MNKATLILFPLPIIENQVLHLPDFNHQELASINHFVVERTRTARRYIRAALPKADIDAMHFLEIDKRDKGTSEIEFVDWLKAGYKIGLMSESGNPCIADPGHEYVRLAHKHQAKVIPLVGPSSILLSLIASGLNGNQFSFHGYLPVKEPALKQKIGQLQKQIDSNGATQIFIETPYRNVRLLQNLKKYLRPSLLLCVAEEINSPDQKIITKQIKDWTSKEIEGEKRNMIFLIGN